MTKMYGSLTGSEVQELAERLAKEITNDPDSSNRSVMVPKSTLVALVTELKECMSRKFYFELGRSIQLEESRLATEKTIPKRFVGEFNDGFLCGEHSQTRQKCESCQFRIKTLDVMNGKVYLATGKEKQI